jgi:hypothetical protein
MAYRGTIKSAYLFRSRFSTGPERCSHFGKHWTTRMQCSLWCSAVSWRNKRFLLALSFWNSTEFMLVFFTHFTNLDNIYVENHITTRLSRTGILYYNMSFMHQVYFVTDPHVVTKQVPVPEPLHPSIPSATNMWEILQSRPDKGDGVHLNTLSLYH